jgi:Bifunctional DNA primase/polymerase, N-terminal/Primase C terminal 1 (PriCT-1)
MLSAERSLAAAVAYASRFGWAVFPAGGDNGKKPIVQHGVKAATRAVEVIRRLWPKQPSNVAVAAGEGSGFWVLDVDGEEGAETLADLERQHGTLPPTPRAFTPSGGEHLFFAYTPGLCNRVRVLPGLDVRTDGGYVIAAPSMAPGRARPWAWDVDAHLADVPLASAPDWLLALVAKPNVSAGSGETAPAWVETATGVVPEGCRNDTAASIIGHLLRRWTEPTLTFALVAAWNAAHCRPPLPEDELAAVFNSVLARELRRREAA